MIIFVNTYGAKIDDKGRLVLPVAFKNALAEATDLGGYLDMRMMIKVSDSAKCIEMVPFGEWAKEAEKLKSRLNFLKAEHSFFWRAYMQGRAVVEPDTKLGRINIPNNMLEEIGAEKEVLFIGVGDKIEIWNKDTYEATKVSHEQFSALAAEFAHILDNI